jgi:uncharacterized protein (TIGR00251 family)
MSFFEPDKNGCVLRIKLSPNAKKSALGIGVFVDADGREYLKASVVCVPEKGKANKGLLKMLSKRLKIAISDLKIISGETDHKKKVQISAPLTAELEEKIALLKEEK